MPAQYFADAGTPLMWLGCFQLFFGNLLLGSFEAWLFARFTKKKPKASWIVGANYVSMIAGLWLPAYLAGLSPLVAQDPVRLGRLVLIGAFALSFVITLAVEWPFFAASVDRFSFRGSVFRPMMLTNVVSYAGLLLVSMTIGSVSALTNLHPVSPADLRPLPGWVFYVAADGLTVHRMRLDGTRDEVVGSLPPPKRKGDYWSMQLFFQEDFKSGLQDLYIGCNPESVAVRRGFKGRADDPEPNLNGRVYVRSFECSFTFIPGQQLRTGFWAREGLVVGDRRYALETPFLAMNWRSPTLLPDGHVLAVFGDAIMLIDPKSGQVSKIGVGQAPAVLLDP